MYTYTLLELESKTFGELKKIGYELNVLPAGDRRRRQSWIEAIAGVNPPLLALLETSPAEVQAQESPIIETVEAPPAADEVQAQEPPIESKFGRIVYPRPAQGAISQVAKTSPGVEVDRVSEAISQVAKTSPGVSRKTSTAHQLLELFKSSAHIIEDSPAGESVAELSQSVIEQATKTYTGVEVDQVQEAIKVQAQEPYPRNARRDCPRCVGIQSLYWTRNFCMEQWVIRCLYCDYERPKYSRFAHLEPPVYGPEEYPDGKEALRQASTFQAPPPSYSAPGDYCCTWAPIAVPPTEPPPAVNVGSVEDLLPECSNCFGDGYTEDEFGLIKFWALLN